MERLAFASEIAKEGISTDEIIEISTTDIQNLHDYEPKRNIVYKKSEFHISTVERKCFISDGIGVIVFFRRPSSLKRA
ncbi:MAG: hypothetical protein PHY30_01300 [Candidatus Pacebacteria bacterium]|nr:hypothetical protein [Candidatus Paceibacterota bacterium]